MPWFWIVAGPNGAGKSTLVDAGVAGDALGTDLVSLNADVRTKQILDSHPSTSDANLQAAIDIDTQVADNIEQGTNFLVETVLSSDKYLDDIERALALGFQLGVIYVGLATPQDAIRRVALRRAMGGHDVPRDRIVARWSRSIAMLGRVAPFAHRLYVFDNTATTGPVLIARKEGKGVELLAPGRIPEIDTVLTAAQR
ncbi:MAG TPA: zeta toxin family protein [Acetobacteraceae bacterium]|nr:zeta toxin family protein [Acetobacteraceae bacterium]